MRGLPPSPNIKCKYPPRGSIFFLRYHNPLLQNSTISGMTETITKDTNPKDTRANVASTLLVTRMQNQINATPQAITQIQHTLSASTYLMRRGQGGMYHGGRGQGGEDVAIINMGNKGKVIGIKIPTHSIPSSTITLTNLYMGSNCNNKASYQLNHAKHPDHYRDIAGPIEFVHMMIQNIKHQSPTITPRLHIQPDGM